MRKQIKEEEKELFLLSPDGHTTDRESTFKNMDEVEAAFDKWKERYKKQGYYSSNDFGRIPIEFLSAFMTVSGVPYLRNDEFFEEDK